MHASLTSSMLILGPAVSGRDLLIDDLTLAAFLDGRHRSARCSRAPHEDWRDPKGNRSRARRDTVGSVRLSPLAESTVSETISR